MKIQDEVIERLWTFQHGNLPTDDIGESTSYELVKAGGCISLCYINKFPGERIDDQRLFTSVLIRKIHANVM